MEPIYLGPFTVSKKISNVIYEVYDDKDKKYKKVHIINMRIFYDRKIINWIRLTDNPIEKLDI